MSNEPNVYMMRTPEEVAALWGVMPALNKMLASTAMANVPHWRATLIDENAGPELAGYPHGLYLEGWDNRIVEDPPFHWPMTAA